MALIKYKYFAVITLCLSVLLYGCGGGVKFNPNHKPKPLNKNISFKKKTRRYNLQCYLLTLIQC